MRKILFGLLMILFTGLTLVACSASSKDAPAKAVEDY